MIVRVEIQSGSFGGRGPRDGNEPLVGWVKDGFALDFDRARAVEGEVPDDVLEFWGSR